jgi:hypothetical protein
MYAGVSFRSLLAWSVALACSATPPALARSLTVIHGFGANANLGGGITADQNGTLYGVLSNGGGCGDAGCVFALSPPTATGGTWSYGRIHQFQSNGDGYGPQGQLALGPNGELYGYTGYGSGIIYRLTPPPTGSETWSFTKLATLGDGFTPSANAPLIFRNGALIGISTGGSQTCPYVGCGGLFEVAPSLNGGWSVTTIAAFDGGSFGGSPAALAGPDANSGFYVANQYQGKVVYLAPHNSAWRAAIAASYPRATGLGCLVIGGGGDIYGVAGIYNRGKLFRLQPNTGATQWTETIIAEVSDHQYVPCPEIQGPAGSLIGTVFGDQDFYDGDIFQLSPPAHGAGSWRYKILTQVGQTGRFGPINAVFGFGGNLYSPVNTAYGPPSAILKYIFP